MKLLNKLILNVKKFFYMDKYVNIHHQETDLRNQRGMALIGSVGFLIMSIINVVSKSWMMLITTLVCSFLFLVGYIVSKLLNKNWILMIIFTSVYIVIFSMYIILGGNDGFASLWVLLATYGVLIAIDFKLGLFVSIYFMLLIFLLFLGPLSIYLPSIDKAGMYTATFRQRFPFLFLINFFVAIFIVVRYRIIQYELLIKQEEITKVSTMDELTETFNRNKYLEYEKNFALHNLNSLSAIYIDVNGLHESNNTQGHDAGDELLKGITAIAKKSFKDDLIFRMGGDEFVILCENQSETEAFYKSQIFKEEIIAAKYSISFGIAYSDKDINLHDLVKAADNNMYTAKKAFYEDNKKREYHQ